MKLKGCLITDMEKIQDEYYVLFCEAVKKRDKAIKEKDFKKYQSQVESYNKCFDNMKHILRFINNL